MPRPKQRTEALRSRVVDTAVAMLSRDGVEAFTTRRVAAGAGTSTPAVYELFGDRAGLVREVFFHGFRQLHAKLARLRETGDPRADVVAVIRAFRRFAHDNPRLAEVMFSHPFADFHPGPDEARAGSVVRELIVGRVRRCVDAGIVAGNATDIAHVLLALAQGLSTQESAGWLGTSAASMDRRWALGVSAVLDGLAAGGVP